MIYEERSKQIAEERSKQIAKKMMMLRGHGSKDQSEQKQDIIDSCMDIALEMTLLTEKLMIEKACDYLCNNIDKDLVIYHNNTWLKRDEFVKRFKKAMEE